MDKEFLRLWIAARCDPYREKIPDIPRDTLIEFSRRYIALYETVTGQSFQPAQTAKPVRERVRTVLQKIYLEQYPFKWNHLIGFTCSKKSMV